jgi:asparagine synthase (glutamine-hydrolysing)
MCGIYALISNKPINDTKYRRNAIKASHKLRHRGPDGTGYHQTKYGCFSHMRLSIIDPKSGTQPLTNQDESVVLCVNGEIFNYKKLKKEFSDYKYKTGSDCEVILALYENSVNDIDTNTTTNTRLTHTQIVSLMSQLNGQYSFILHDTRNDMVFVARDPFGITQSYYGMDKYGHVHIASEIKALTQCITVGVIPSGSYLYFDAKNPQVTPINFFNDTKDGQWVGLENTTDTTLPTYSYQEQPILDTISQDVLLTQIRETFEKAVIARLMSDVPFGILLSGGLDSSLVASVAVKYIREHPELYGPNPIIHTFSIGDVDSTDLPYARKVADFLGTTHHEIDFTVEEGINSIDEIVSVLETYDITTIRASTPHYLMSRKIKSMGVKMVLSGEGSDEILGGYLYFHKAPSDMEHQLECKRRVLDLGYFDCLRADKSTMGNGLESRVPFLDTEFVNLCINIHKDIKTQLYTESHIYNNNGKPIEKYILRKAFDIKKIECNTDEHGIDSCVEKPVYLPSEVLWRQKEQFSDSITYRWIDTLKSFTDKEIKENYLAAFNNREYLYPYNTPQTTEAFYYRQIFERLYPNREKTVKAWQPNTKWLGINSSDPSGRVNDCHINTTTQL